MAKLHFYYSAMNAGKSTLLLQSNHNYHERGMHTLLYTPQLDDRYGRGKIASRIGLQADAVMFAPQDDLFKMTAEALQADLLIKCVLLDEAHFLSREQVIQLGDVCDRLNVPVLAYGIRADFRGEPFDGSKYLLTTADLLIEVKTICGCGRKATMTCRLDANGKRLFDGEQALIAGNESYVAVCRKHFREGILAHQQQADATREGMAACT